MEANEITIAQTDERALPLQPGRQYTPAQRFFLKRMALLTQIAERGPVDEGWQSRLLAKALYSTYLDCRTLNVDEEARTLLHCQQPIV